MSGTCLLFLQVQCLLAGIKQLLGVRLEVLIVERWSWLGLGWIAGSICKVLVDSRFVNVTRHRAKGILSVVHKAWSVQKVFEVRGHKLSNGLPLKV